MENIKEIFEKINNANNILITAHINPDGDAVGSCLALYNYIKLINKNVQVCLDEVPDKFSFLLIPRPSRVISKILRRFDFSFFTGLTSLTYLNIIS